jgi:integrase
MSRRLTGTKTRVDAGWRVELPVSHGATGRTRHTFLREADADAWLTAGIACLTRREGLPLPPVGQLTRDSRRAPVPVGTTFKAVADEWADERYIELNRADLDREDQVRAHIRRIDAFLTSNCLVMETMTRQRVKELSMWLVRPDDALSASIPPGFDPNRRVTISQALQLPGNVSRSTIKRRIGTGELKPVAREGGTDLFTVADLWAANVFGGESGLRRGPRTHGAVSPRVASDAMWVFNSVCAYGSSVLNVDVPKDRATLVMPRAARKAPKPKAPVELLTCVEVARRLHVVHQLTLWIMRILGVRIGEAFGIRVGDVVDLGVGQPGLVRINEQGGRKMRNRGASGQVIEGHSTTVLKNEHSYRVIVVPPMLMELIRTFITIFHTDEADAVLMNERLIPGLTAPGRGGQGTFRDALTAVVEELREEMADAQWVLPFEDLTGAFCLTPHGMRATLLSDLDHRGIKDGHLKRLAGHVRGSSVLHRHYLMDDPQLKPARKTAKVVEADLRAQVPGGLMVPTMMRCTTGNQPALAASGARIDVALVELGWLVVPAEDDEPLLTSVEVATTLGVSVQVARRWLADGLVPSVVWRQRVRGAERRARLGDVLEVRDTLAGRVTLRRLADELGCSYSLVYQFVAANDLALESWGVRARMGPPETEERIRAHVHRQAVLRERAVPLSVAAQRLGESPVMMLGLMSDGVLVEDDRAADGRRMLTRDSVDAEVARRSTSATEPGDLVPWVQARRLLAASDAQLRVLVAAGTVEVRWRGRSRCVTRSSVMHALVDLRPEAILAQADAL